MASPSLALPPLWGSQAFFNRTIAHTIDIVLWLHSYLPLLEDAQVALHLLHSCLGVCKVNHLLRTVPPHLFDNQLSQFDTSLRSTLSEILHSPINDHVWSQASLPFQLGGLGIRVTTRAAPAAFIASAHLSLLVAASIPVEFPSPSTPFFGVEVTKRNLADLLGAPDPDDLSREPQNTLQAELDQLQYDNLLEELDLYGKNYLKCQPHQCLPPPPLANLGLSISNNEAIMATRIWLGIATFPRNPPLLCQCGSVIDPNGDHLLSCGHGPLCIRQHNALRDVVYQALCLDNPSTRREQRIFRDSLDRPGDVFHPDFTDGKPSYFDICLQHAMYNNCPSSFGATMPRCC